jgi:hypothetical protein
MCLALGACFLLSDILELSHREFSLGWSYYLVLWGYLACCIGAGLLLLSGVVIGRWFVTALAVLLAICAVPSDDLATGTLGSILKQAALKK